MNQKGIIEVYLILIVLVLGSLGTIAYKLDSRGFERGKAQVEAEVAKRDNETLKQALDGLKQAQDRVRVLEDKNKADLAQTTEQYKKDLTNVKNTKDRTIAALNDGTLKLRVKLANCTSITSGNPPSEVDTSGQSDNGTTTGELSRETSEFFIGEASRADKIVKQLSAAQEALTKDREVCK